MPRRAAYAVIADSGGLIAFVRGATHVWLIGGGVETGESAGEALRREAVEEAGREISIDGILGSARQYFRVDATHYGMHATFFAATLGETVSEPQETIAWLDAMDVGAQIFHDSHRWAIERSTVVERLGV